VYTIDNLANNDRTKWDYFLEMNLIEFLNTLAYNKDKQDYIEDEMKKWQKRQTY
jgi:hypothetical protein